MEGLTQQQCDHIAAKLNARSRKRLGYKTSQDYFYK
jgi:IS30 family transposase